MLACAEQYRAFADTLPAGTVQNYMCGHTNKRCFERLPGYIDLEVWSMDGLATISDEPFLVSMPVCKLEEPDDFALILYESHM